MLLYTHAINDVRAAARQLPVNSFWVSGSGALARKPSPPPSTLTPRILADGVFKSDWTHYAQAWAALDAGLISELLKQQREGSTVCLTLCGERGFETWQSRPRSWHGSLSNWLQYLSVLSPQPILIKRKQL